MYPRRIEDVEAVTDALMDWFAAFGTCWKWVSDQGTHFKKEVMKDLKEKIHSAHLFKLSYYYWSNETVEIVFDELFEVQKVNTIRIIVTHLKTSLCDNPGPDCSEQLRHLKA